MSIVSILTKMPCWYLVVLIAFSMYYAVRGIVEQRIIHGTEPLSKVQKLICYYIQEFLFKVIFTASAFVALFMADYIFLSLKSVADIGAGTAIVLIFLIVWGITGASGYLTFLIVSGKFPTLK